LKNLNTLDFYLLVVDIVNENIITQVTGFGEENPLMVQTHHPVDKETEVFPSGQHECVTSELAK